MQSEYDMARIVAAERLRQAAYFTAAATIPIRRLFMLDTAGNAVVTTANVIDTIGAEVERVEHVVGDIFLGQVAGIVTIVADAQVSPGRALKAGYGGRSGQLIDADLVGSSIVNDDGAAFGTAGDTSRVHIISGSADDTFDVIIYGESATLGSLESVVVTLDGTTSVAISDATIDNDEWSNILGLSCLGGEVAAGTITIGNTGGAVPIVAITVGQSSAGYVVPTDPRAYNAIVTVRHFAQIANALTAHIGVLGYDETNDLVGEIVAVSGTDSEVSTNSYREIVAILTGSVASADSFGLLVTATEEDENRKVGTSLEGATGVGEEFGAVLR